MGLGGVGWDVNVRWHLRHEVDATSRMGLGGVGWDVNVGIGKEPAAKCPVNHEDDEDNNYATYDDDDDEDDDEDDDDDDDDDDDEDGADDDHACGPQAARHGVTR